MWYVYVIPIAELFSLSDANEQYTLATLDNFKWSIYIAIPQVEGGNSILVLAITRERAHNLLYSFNIHFSVYFGDIGTYDLSLKVHNFVNIHLAVTSSISIFRPLSDDVRCNVRNNNVRNNNVC